MFETVENIQYNAILVTLAITEKNNKEYIEDIDASVAELEKLAEAASVTVAGNIIQNKDSVDVTYFIGKGKVQEIKELSAAMGSNLVIFNHELTGSQIRNLEDQIGVDVIDRTMLILEIFSKRAVTKEGRLQVELAQLRYRLPRLMGLGAKLSRQGGGIGSKGPGEKKLETDRRHIEKRIFEIEKDLREIAKNQSVQRAKRIKSDIPIIALVGYSNVGKSTIVNEIIKQSADYAQDKEVFVEDMLFATLGTHLRKAALLNGNAFLVTDTVGFVSRLPHTLVKAFRSTLEEIHYADLLLHVIDASDKNYSLLKSTTEEVLSELNIHDKPILLVNNKMDKVDEDAMLLKEEPYINISAKNKADIIHLLAKIQELLFEKFIRTTLFFSYNQSGLINELHKKYSSLQSVYEEDGIKIVVELSKEDSLRYQAYILEQERI